MSSAYNPIPLQVQAPAPSSLLSSVGAFQNIRDQISQIALRHAQTEQANQQAQEYEVQAAQRNKDLSDQNTIQSIEKDPDSYAKITSGDLSPVAGKVQDATLQKLKASVNTALQSEATRSTEDLARRGTAHANIGTSLASLQQLRAPDGSLDLARVNESLPGVLQGLAPELKILGVDTSKMPDSISDEDHLKLLSSRLGAAAALTAAAQKLKDEQAGTAQKTAQAASEQATADLNQFKLNMMKGLTDPTAIASSVDALIDPAKFPQANKDAKAAAVIAAKSGDPAKVTDAVKSIYDEQVGHPAGAKATQDAEKPGKLQLAKDMIPIEANAAAARANAEIAPHVAEQKAIAAQSPGAFAGILDKTSRDQAINEADKIQQAYTEKVRTSQQLVDTINAAQNGNKAAPGVIPIEQVRSVLANGRVNQAELKGVSSNAGSLLDKIDGWVAGKTEGQPIPAEILKDMATLAVITQQAAKRGYRDGLARLKNRGVDTDKIAEPDLSTESQGHGIPDLGSTFNGGKVLKVEKVH